LSAYSITLSSVGSSSRTLTLGCVCRIVSMRVVPDRKYPIRKPEDVLYLTAMTQVNAQAYLDIRYY